MRGEGSCAIAASERAAARLLSTGGRGALRLKRMRHLNLNKFNDSFIIFEKQMS